MKLDGCDVQSALAYSHNTNTHDLGRHKTSFAPLVDLDDAGTRPCRV
jgi:hypothetical protein